MGWKTVAIRADRERSQRVKGEYRSAMNGSTAFRRYATNSPLARGPDLRQFSLDGGVEGLILRVIFPRNRLT